MSARDRLWHLYQHPDSASAFGDALDAYARDLAHQVRGIRSTVPDLKASDAWKRGYDAALLVAADLIDPTNPHILLQADFSTTRHDKYPPDNGVAEHERQRREKRRPEDERS
ncbi:hypothetical protein PV729_45300 [Streptomyces europaeiscabiei]|uniref:Transposase n=1 Tax=Streptomyces europaeiscabiei TaxID=146819 RepID=A0ABU4P157_9ACTN|nr:hypothetical protein [Streptomyces europaeiscabiei]MDX2757851.1 hypothetical protein [Streptomyces europaeiscabiei]MDX3549734.1 hypothetical protein [Streptomyces europaeiscabiei]MDX3558792.1 hypothetical protein [Streptomyces europaeiscabiei]MDX3707075.1 hypothetical protein [Streptomyces europaeiscabiei]